MTTPAGAVAGNAAQAQREAAPRGRAGDSLFSRKYGPLPGWGWALLAGGGALAYFWWRRRSLQQNTSTGTSVTTGSGSVTDQLAALQDEIDALQGELATSGTSTTTGGHPPPPEPHPLTTVPKVVGMRATPAVARLKAAGLKAHSNPPRERGVAQKVVSQTPGPGKRVQRDSTVDLHLEKVGK